MPAKWEKGSRAKVRPLSLRHEALVDAYFGAANFCKTQAARLAGYKHPNDSLIVFNHPSVAAEIERRERVIREKYKVSYDRVTDEIAKIAYSHVLNYTKVDAEGNLLFDFSKADAHQLAAIGSVTVDTYMDGKGKDAPIVKRVRVKPYDKLAALEALMRHAGLSKDKTGQALVDVAHRLAGGLRRLGKEKKKEDKNG